MSNIDFPGRLLWGGGEPFCQKIDKTNQTVNNNNNTIVSTVLFPKWWLVLLGVIYKLDMFNTFGKFGAVRGYPRMIHFQRLLGGFVPLGVIQQLNVFSAFGWLGAAGGHTTNLHFQCLWGVWCRWGLCTTSFSAHVGARCRWGLCNNLIFSTSSSDSISFFTHILNF